MKTCEKLNKFPIEIQEEVKSILKGWTNCYIEQNENTKEYRVSISVGISKCYNPWQLLEVIYNIDLYTKDEIEKNANEYWVDVDMKEW